MCNYKLAINKNQTITCGVRDTAVPIDSKGLCIFHSEDLSWKAENDFNRNFKNLLEGLVSKIDSEKCKSVKLPFQGFIMINSDSIHQGSSDFLIKNVENNDKIDFSYSTFYSNIIFQGCKFREGHFENAVFKAKATFRDVIFKGNAYFTNASFHNHVLFFKCDFDDFAFFDGCNYYITDKGPANLRMEEVAFKGDSDFSKSTCFHHVLFKNVKFYLSADFDNTSFEHEFMWDNVEVCDIAHFYGTSFNKPTSSSSQYMPVHLTDVLIADNGSVVFQGKKPMDDVVKGEMFLALNALSTGKILFRDFNLKRIYSKTRKELLELEKKGMVEFGDGCQKYYCQTDIFEIWINETNQKFILDVTKVFCNYFEFQQGVNLGVEIVSKNADVITYFYFTDEKITKEDFLIKIKQTERDLWYTFDHLIKTTSLAVPKNQIEFRNILCDLSNIFIKIGNTVTGGGAFNSYDLNKIFRAVAPFGDQVINADDNQLTKLAALNDKYTKTLIVMGDLITGNNVANRSSVIGSFNTNSNNQDEEILRAVQALSEMIQNQSDQEAKRHFQDFAEELSKPKPEKEKLKGFWSSLTSILPNILTMTNIVEHITKLF